MKAFITQYNSTYYVTVQEYKYNSLRDDSCWVTNHVRTFKKQQDAIKYCNRF